MLTIFDDLALMRIINSPPLRNDQVAVLGGAADSNNHRFTSLVYGTSGHFRGFWPTGVIGGSAVARAGSGYSVKRVRLDSADLAGDMAGAPVHDQQRGLVVAITTGTFAPPSAAGASQMAYGIDAKCLEAEPFRLPIKERFEPRTGPEPSPLIVANVAQPNRHAVLWAFEENVAAQFFYKSVGWRSDGLVRLDPWLRKVGIFVRERRYHADITLSDGIMR